MNSTSIDDAGLFRAYWDDGLLDLFFGLGVLTLGIGWETPLGPLTAMLLPLWIVLWNPLRRRIVEPRAGYVRFSRARRQRSERALRMTWALGVGVLLLVAAAATGLRGLEARAALERAVVGLPALLLAIGAMLAAGLTGARRFIAYGLTLVAAAAGVVALQLGPAMALVSAGLVVTGCGGFLLARFVRDSRAYEEHV